MTNKYTVNTDGIDSLKQPRSSLFSSFKGFKWIIAERNDEHVALKNKFSVDRIYHIGDRFHSNK